jgi:single-strand DNA-binding protein
MRSVNKVIVIGHLAADPEQDVTKTGRTRVTFPVATHRDTTSEGATKEVTDYHRVVAIGKLGEICAKYLAKGQGIYVEGMLLNRAYEDNGQRRYVTEIRADEVNMLTWKKKDGVTKVTLDHSEGEAA